MIGLSKNLAVANAVLAAVLANDNTVASKTFEVSAFGDSYEAAYTIRPGGNVIQVAFGELEFGKILIVWATPGGFPLDWSACMNGSGCHRKLVPASHFGKASEIILDLLAGRFTEED